jgi:hypothetical protein
VVKTSSNRPSFFLSLLSCSASLPLRSLFFPSFGASPSCSLLRALPIPHQILLLPRQIQPPGAKRAARAVTAPSRRSRQVVPAPPPCPAPACSGDGDEEPPRGCRSAAGEGADEVGHAAGWEKEELRRRRCAGLGGMRRRSRRGRRGTAGGGRPRPGAPTTTAPSTRGVSTRLRSRRGRRGNAGGGRPRLGAPTTTAPSARGVTTRRRIEAGEIALAQCKKQGNARCSVEY